MDELPVLPPWVVAFVGRIALNAEWLHLINQNLLEKPNTNVVVPVATLACGCQQVLMDAALVGKLMACSLHSQTGGHDDVSGSAEFLADQAIVAIEAV